MRAVVKEMLWFWLVVVPLTPAWLPLLALRVAWRFSRNAEAAIFEAFE